MRDEDARAVHDVSVVTFTDLEARFHYPPSPPPPPNAPLVRFSPPDRDRPGRRVGGRGGRAGRRRGARARARGRLGAVAARRAARRASRAGVGRALLERALAYAATARRGRDHPRLARPARAARLRARSGFDAAPGDRTPRAARAASALPPGVRDGDARDLPLTEAVDRARPRRRRTAATSTALLSVGRRLLVVARARLRGVGRDGDPRCSPRSTRTRPRDLLRAALAAAPDGEDDRVEWITAAQQWAVAAVLDAGLDAAARTARCSSRGDVGPFTPYLPSGAYL